MLKGKDIIGRNIVSISDGKHLDKVHDLIFDYDANRLLALLVDEGGWFRAAKVVPYDAVRSLGENAVMVDSEAAVVSARDDSRIAELLSAKQKSLIGLKLLTTDGRDLGRITDVYFEALSGQVVGYEASGGLFADLTGGRTFVPAPQSIKIGADAAIVPLSIAAAMEEGERGGLQGALHRAGEGVNQGVSNAASSVRSGYDEAASSVRGGVQELGSSVRAVYKDAASSVREGYQQASHSLQEQLDDLQRAGREKQVEFALGKPAGHDVVADNGTVIVREGERISPRHIDLADRSGALLKLVAAASAGSVKRGAQSLSQDLSQGAQQVGQQARQQVAHTAEELKARVEPLRERAEDLAAQAEAAAQRPITPRPMTVPEGVQRVVVTPGTPQPVQNILGRRVQYDVYGPNRTLIAAQGQIVDAAVQGRARAQGREEALIDATQAGAQPPISDQLAGGVASVTASASHLFDRAKQWLGEKREEVVSTVQEQEEAARQQSIKAALGRPVTRVILDPQDHIILNVGEVITNRAVQEAQRVGVLDILLDSVSHEPVSINPLEVRPQETGKAALDSQGEVK